MLTARSLPPLSADEAAHGARVAAHLHALIAAAGGWLAWSRFMEAALYAPGLGYYMAGRRPFGAGGDFVTAPELSPLYGRCLAVQLEELLENTAGGDVVEYGAGSGRLAADLLTALAARDALPAHYRIVEISAPLREAQRERLERLSSSTCRIEWLDHPPVKPWRGVAIANEVVDALPVERFRIAGDVVECLGVIAEGDGFAWQARPADAALAGAVAHIAAKLPAPPIRGYVSELCLMLPAWVAAATASLAQGAMLVADYGLPRAQYYHPSRDGGTLTAFHRHRRVDDVLLLPGLQDLTAWVDFSALTDAARSAGLSVGGFATQAHFLAALGIDRELAALVEQALGADRHALTQGAQLLMHPGEMGERFKILALTRGIGGALTGFQFRDLSESL